MSPVKLLLEAAIVVGEYLLNRARKQAPAERVKHEQARKQQAEWAKRVAARKSK